ncbi:hypothetical protein KVR01_004301 [Diaporthe batatas]|uniref:uncharacterized protein n=1 Tax=Diaporthe batatas TaxID=748121 RepID=UPI001D03BDD4|nr:uncharacterized protein KVR01_004301 [Diaporthe batatas]KAG8165749.1 hypothetical protein KVR01_004301 [Diaporthe batatas]
MDAIPRSKPDRQDNAEDTADVNQYRYPPLPSTGHTRLVSLHPAGTTDEDLVVDLNPTPIVPDGPLYYEAVSYVWDTDQTPFSVYVGKEKTTVVSVTRNLAVALRNMRYPDRPRRLWIDALCIDQSNDLEKGPQVAQMGAIYSFAAHVIAWLGPEQHESTRALRFIARMGTHVDYEFPAWLKHVGVPENKAYSSPMPKMNPDGTILITPEDTRSIYHLLCRGWFSRLWIRQEILALEKEAVVQCGTCAVAWPLFRRGLVGLYKSNRHRPPCEYETRLYERILLLRGFIGQPSTVGLGFIRVAFGQSSCSDRRDRVYAVLNFLPEAEREVVGIPDYTKDFGTVFRDVLWRWIVRFECCNLLSQCEPQPDDGPDVPSWTPDWSKKETIFGRMFWRGLASSQLAAVCTLSPDRRTLTLTGTSTMTITRLQPVPDILTARHIREVADAIRQLIPESELTGDYVTGITMKEAYTRTILANALAEHREPWVGHEPGLEDAMRTLEDLYRPEAQRDLEDESLGPHTGFFGVSRAMIGGRQLMHTSGGHLGIAPPLARQGDIVCVFIGCHTPMVLRPHGEDQFRIVGECYALGISEGEELLGPLPPDIRRVYASSREWGVHSCWEDARTRERSLMDPRLEQQDPYAKLKLTAEDLEKLSSGVREFDIV